MAKYTTRGKTCRIVFLNDFHCGHQVGITPPGFGVTIPSEIECPRKHKAYQMGRAIYDWFRDDIAKIKREKEIDIAVVVGDEIDGRGERSGSTECITTDRFIQCKMAKKIIMRAQPQHILMTYGTAYHTGQSEDFEDYLTDILSVQDGVEKVKVGSHEWLKVNNIVFDIKHHSGASSVPHGRNTPLAREKLWNMLWADRGEQPNADVLVRAHTHYHAYCGDANYTCISLPALQGYGSKYGARRCSGTLDLGYVVFDVTPDGEYSWEPRLANLPEQKSSVVEF